MKIDISDIIKTDGASHQIDFNGNIEGLGRYADITIDGPICLNAVLTNTGGILRLEGTLKTHFTGECSMCLTDAGADLDLKIRESIVDAKAGDDTESYTYEGKLVDLDKIIRDNIILNLPMKLLCRQTCKGVCPVCGGNRNEVSCSCSREETNSQMEALKGFFSN